MGQPVNELEKIPELYFTDEEVISFPPCYLRNLIVERVRDQDGEEFWYVIARVATSSGQAYEKFAYKVRTMGEVVPALAMIAKHIDGFRFKYHVEPRAYVQVSPEMQIEGVSHA